MNSWQVLYISQTSDSAKRLAKAFDIPAIKSIEHKNIIRWGTAYIKNPYGCRCINKPDAIVRAVDKFGALKILSKKVPVPKHSSPWHPDIGVPCVVRPPSHTCGQGFRIVTNVAEATKVPSYYHCLQLIDTEDELRIFVVKDEAVLSYIKRKGKITALKMPRNEDTGWILSRCDVTEDLKKIAVAAVQSLGLDFGAVDLAIDRAGHPYVFEVNTAPELNSWRAKKIAEKMSEKYKIPLKKKGKKTKHEKPR